MNNPERASNITPHTVTTGPLPASTKIYSSPEAAPSLRVPLREIALSEKSGEAPIRVYDSSGPYTDSTIHIDVEKGCRACATRGSSNAATASATRAA